MTELHRHEATANLLQKVHELAKRKNDQHEKFLEKGSIKLV